MIWKWINNVNTGKSPKKDYESKIGVCFVKDNNNHKHSLMDLNLNVIGCVTILIIMKCVQAKSDWIDLKFWVKLCGDECKKIGIILSKIKIRNILDKFEFIVDCS